jgi:hypothetical protein
MSGAPTRRLYASDGPRASCLVHRPRVALGGQPIWRSLCTPHIPRRQPWRPWRRDARLDSTRLDERFAHSLVGIERPRPRARDDEREEGFESHWRRRRQTELRWVHSALSKDREGYREVGHLSHEDRRTMKPLSPCLCVLLGKPLCLTIVGAGVVCSERQSLRRRFDRRDRCDNWCEHPRRSERGEDAGLSIGTA